MRLVDERGPRWFGAGRGRPLLAGGSHDPGWRTPSRPACGCTDIPPWLSITALATANLLDGVSRERAVEGAIDVAWRGIAGTAAS